LFFVGSHASCADAVAQEQRIYHDVVVLPVLESYDNLSKKTRAMLHYLQTTVTWRGGKRQPWSDYVAKVDDDVYIDVEAFLGRLHLYQGRKYLYLGEWWGRVGVGGDENEARGKHEARQAGGRGADACCGGRARATVRTHAPSARGGGRHSPLRTGVS
jgi:hypothetical protein